MEVALVIAMFVTTALSLNFTASKKVKLAGMCDVINLCLIVAVAYQFQLVNSIIMVLVVLIIAVVAILFIRQYLKKKKLEQETKQIETKEEE